MVCEKTSGASYGNAFLAATAIGLVKRDSISKWNPVAKTIIAQPSAKYDKAHDLFHRLYEQTKDIAIEIT
jgi:xylulokinase